MYDFGWIEFIFIRNSGLVSDNRTIDRPIFRYRQRHVGIGLKDAFSISMGFIGFDPCFPFLANQSIIDGLSTIFQLLFK